MERTTGAGNHAERNFLRIELGTVLCSDEVTLRALAKTTASQNQSRNGYERQYEKLVHVRKKMTVEPAISEDYNFVSWQI
ncbi:hypothetical protein N008_06660 [Hymenobacter sp. APR13]|nr:hypothetical protein N008_06660 [Hymenobacter sp. APR13]